MELIHLATWHKSISFLPQVFNDGERKERRTDKQRDMLESGGFYVQTFLPFSFVVSWQECEWKLCKAKRWRSAWVFRLKVVNQSLLVQSQAADKIRNRGCCCTISPLLHTHVNYGRVKVHVYVAAELHCLLLFCCLALPLVYCRVSFDPFISSPRLVRQLLETLLAVWNGIYLVVRRFENLLHVSSLYMQPVSQDCRCLPLLLLTADNLCIHTTI